MIVFEALGEIDATFVSLEKAYEEWTDCTAWLNVDPRFDSIPPDNRLQNPPRRVRHIR